MAQAFLRSLQIALQRMQARGGTEPQSVQLGSHQRDPIAVVVGLGLQLVDLIACAHGLSSDDR